MPKTPLFFLFDEHEEKFYYISDLAYKQTNNENPKMS